MGQTQLLALTRALLQLQAASEAGDGPVAGDPPGHRGRKPVVLLDEVTAALDPDTEAVVYDVIRDEVVDKGHTVIMVSHKLGAYAHRMRRGRDKVVWIRDGQVERVQTAEALLDPGR